MKALTSLTLLLSAATLYSCRPKPLNIEVKQVAPVLTLSSATPDNHTVLVSAGYSINSLVKLSDSATGTVKIPKEMLLNDAILTITKSGGATDTLHFISDGLYGNTDISLEQQASYTIQVYDQGKGLTGTATTTYQELPEVGYGEPVLSKLKGDTTVSVKVQIRNVVSGEYYFVSYNTAANARKQSPHTRMDVSALAAFTPKQLSLIDGSGAKAGIAECNITMQVKPGDTLMVQTAKVDKAYFDYLTAYKRSGSLINQLTGEPINMPSNVVKGFGYFSLFAPHRKVFYLKH